MTGEYALPIPHLNSFRFIATHKSTVYICLPVHVDLLRKKHIYINIMEHEGGFEGAWLLGRNVLNYNNKILGIIS